MATVRITTSKIDPDQSAADITVEAAGALGTGNVLEIQYDDTEFIDEQVGEQTLIAALERLLNHLKSGHVDWPVV